MPCIVYSEDNTTSRNIAESLLELGDFEKKEPIGDVPHFWSDGIDMIGLKESMLDAGYLDDLFGTDAFIFVCSHRSAREVASLTVHPEGNWAGEALLGGRPRQLSFAAPDWMLCFLGKLSEMNDTGFPVIYEATHHGPLLRTPSLFVEVGGTNEARESKRNSALIAKVVLAALHEGDRNDFAQSVIGIGGLHYEEKFTRMALEKRYAFGHMMSKHYVEEIGMLAQAIERNSIAPDKAVIEWKSIKGSDREMVITELDRLGIDNERA